MGPLGLPAGGLTYLDSAPVIYGVENHPTYAPLLARLWMSIRTGKAGALTSEFALLEALVGAFRRKDPALISDYRAFRQDPDIGIVAVSADVVERAALLRATHLTLRTPDAIHVATAELAGCDAFVTNDKALRSLPSMAVIVLDDLL